MAKDADAPKSTISDPHNVPVTYASAVSENVWNGMIALTFTVNRMTPFIEDGDNPKLKFDNDFVVVSRLRLDLHTATSLRDRLDALISMLSKPEGKAN